MTSPLRHWHSILLACVASLGGLSVSNCLVDPHCYSTSDCPNQKLCNVSGRCIYECSNDADCGEGLSCREHRCQLRIGAPDAGLQSDGGLGGAATDASMDASTDGASDAGDVVPPPPPCPVDMVNIGDAFCIDRYEASRPDASDSFKGADESSATSRQGVLPWQLNHAQDESETARSACLNANKDLCTSSQWLVACRGPEATTYAYGDQYETGICNGIDLFGRSAFHLLPTGSLEACRNRWGVYDLNGNLWEHVLGGGPQGIRGGAYNCSDSATLHRCDYIPSDWIPSARGFRCCKAIQ